MRMRWTELVARKEEIINKYEVLEGLSNNQATSWTTEESVFDSL
jgi:hypothetical protein